jgi:broad specificity phosphatase PhoE
MDNELSPSKKIYFVRHGQSEGNIQNLHGHWSHPLTELGVQQANFVAGRIGHIPAQALVASTMVRAQQTASIIADKVGLEVESSDLFIEAAAPSAIQNKPRTEEASELYRVASKNAHLVPGFRYADEENFDDLRDRAVRALAYLAARQEDHVVVVTHGYFLRMLVAVAVMGPELTHSQARHFMRTFQMENTGLTVFGHKADMEPSPWWLWVWNDHSHLG